MRLAASAVWASSPSQSPRLDTAMFTSNRRNAMLSRSTRRQSTLGAVVTSAMSFTAWVSGWPRFSLGPEGGMGTPVEGGRVSPGW